jgi:dUTP pyrophosphatase
MNVKIKRVKEVPLPKYAKPGDSGFDLVTAEDTLIYSGETKVIPSGLAFEIPEGYEMQIRPRSGISAKSKLRVQLGTIDSGFRGEVGIIVDNTSNDKFPIFIAKYDRIAQAIIAPVEQATFIEVDTLEQTQRGSGGFGSSGVKSAYDKAVEANGAALEKLSKEAE